MLYKAKLRFLKFLKKPGIKKFFYKSVGIQTNYEIRKELIKRYARGKTFADIGCMWRVNGLFSFIAEECGAKKVLAVDIDESDEFWEEKNRRGSKVEFIKGDIHSRETTDKIGECDIVFCSGVLYHSPNPIKLLAQLRKICKESLVLITMIIPEMAARNAAVFYPFLDSRQKKLWDINTTQYGINKPFTQDNEYANWFWGLTPSCTESMLKYSKFKVVKSYVRSFQAFFECRVN